MLMLISRMKFQLTKPRSSYMGGYSLPFFHNANKLYRNLSYLVSLRLRFLGKVMSVERATGSSRQQDNEAQVSKDAPSVVKDASAPSHRYSGVPIAEKLGVDYPFPPHLEYV